MEPAVAAKDKIVQLMRVVGVLFNELCNKLLYLAKSLYAAMPKLTLMIYQADKALLLSLSIGNLLLVSDYSPKILFRVSNVLINAEN